MKCEMHYVKKSDLEQIIKDLEDKHSNMFFAELQGINMGLLKNNFSKRIEKTIKNFDNMI